MAAPTETSIIKAQSTKRPTPPHPNNSGGDALRAGIECLKEHRAEKETKPVRPMGA
jgi:hypothetical protein